MNESLSHPSYSKNHVMNESLSHPSYSKNHVMNESFSHPSYSKNHAIITFMPVINTKNQMLVIESVSFFQH